MATVVVDPSRVEQTCEAYRAIITRYADLHREAGTNRPSLRAGADDAGCGMWELAGHILSHALAAVDLYRVGYATQVDPLVRAIWEATATLSIVGTPEERDLRERWLKGGTIPNAAAARALVRQNERVFAAVDEAPPNVRSSFEGLYGRLSAAAHGQRESVRRLATADGYELEPQPGTFVHVWCVVIFGALIASMAITLDRLPWMARSAALDRPAYTEFVTASQVLARELRARLDYV